MQRSFNILLYKSESLLTLWANHECTLNELLNMIPSEKFDLDLSFSSWIIHSKNIPLITPLKELNILDQDVITQMKCDLSQNPMIEKFNLTQDPDIFGNFCESNEWFIKMPCGHVTKIIN